MNENPNNSGTFGSYYALLVAFTTMKERCQQLQTRLAAVEEENVCLRLECGRDTSTAVVRVADDGSRSPTQTLQVRAEVATVGVASGRKRALSPEVRKVPRFCKGWSDPHHYSDEPTACSGIL